MLIMLEVSNDVASIVDDEDRELHLSSRYITKPRGLQEGIQVATSRDLQDQPGIRYLSSFTNAACSGQDTSDACTLESVSVLSIQSAERSLACGVDKDHHCQVIDRDRLSGRATHLLHLLFGLLNQQSINRALSFERSVLLCAGLTPIPINC